MQPLGQGEGKLEQSLNEAEDALERDRKSKGNVEKLKRKKALLGNLGTKYRAKVR